MAEPILRARSAPATMFVTVGVTEAGTGFWQDRLAAIMLDHPGEAAAAIDVDIAGEALHLEMNDESREASYRAIHRRVRRRPPEEIERVVADVAAQLGVTTADLRVPPVLSPEDVRALGTSPVVEIGSHTLRHPMMSMIDEATQRQEVVDSRARLAQWTGTSVPTFAYPFGSADAFDATSVRIARDAGYDLAVTGVPDRVDRFTNPYRVPRYYVGDWDGLTFERRLQAWIGR